MPLINGVCLPQVCYTRRLVALGAKVLQIVTTNAFPPVAPVTNDVTNNPGFAGLLQPGLNQLNAEADQKCDGCICYGIKFNPPLRAPTSTQVQQTQSTDLQGVTTVYTYIVTAAYDWKTLGSCSPPGSVVEINGKWVPVETAPWKVQRTDGAGSGGGGKKKKKGNAKPRAVARVKKPAVKKTKAGKTKAKKSPRRR